MKNKTYTIKRKRDGQGWQEVGTISARNWSEAKKEFTDNIRNDLANDDNVVWLDEDMYEECSSDFKEREPFKGNGYYDLNGGYWSLPLLDTDVISGYSEDVYSWTINKV